MGPVLGGIRNICRTLQITVVFIFPQMLPHHFSHEQILVARQAFAGLLWSKQTYKYNVKNWRDKFERSIRQKYHSIQMDQCTLLDIKAIMESGMMDNSLKFEDKYRFNQLRQEWMDKLKGKIMSDFEGFLT